MKKKAGKTRGKARRTTAKDLPAKKGGTVKGGGVTRSDFRIVKTIDSASPKLYSS
jgi:hypothetical protein